MFVWSEVWSKRAFVSNVVTTDTTTTTNYTFVTVISVAIHYCYHYQAIFTELKYDFKFMPHVCIYVNRWNKQRYFLNWWNILNLKWIFWLASLNIDHNSNSGQMMSCNHWLNDYSGIWLSFFKADGFCNNEHYSHGQMFENLKKWDWQLTEISNP